MSTFHTNDTIKCPGCDGVLSGATTADGKESSQGPKPGDLSVCLHCSAALTYTDEHGSVRLLTDADIATLGNEELGDIARAKAEVRAFLLRSRQ